VQKCVRWLIAPNTKESKKKIPSTYG